MTGRSKPGSAGTSSGACAYALAIKDSDATVDRPASTPDYRQRSALARRERMHRRLTTAAFVVLAERGVEASIIDEITTLAGVSRGTFYNYFRSNEDVLQTVAITVGDELIATSEPHQEKLEDPPQRLAAGVRIWLTLVRRHPALARFMRRAGTYILEERAGVNRELPGLHKGLASGRYNFASVDLAYLLVGGTVIAATAEVARRAVPADFPELVAERVLLGVGIGHAEAAACARIPLGEVAFKPGSLVLEAEELERAAAQRAG